MRQQRGDCPTRIVRRTISTASASHISKRHDARTAVLSSACIIGGGRTARNVASCREKYDSNSTAEISTTRRTPSTGEGQHSKKEGRKLLGAAQQTRAASTTECCTTERICVVLLPSRAVYPGRCWIFMTFAGQTEIDAVILALATSYSLVGLGYIYFMWTLRRNFFIVLRSPRLACALGLFTSLSFICMTYEYTLSWTDESSTIAGIEDDPVSLVAFPAVLAAEVAVAMMAMRLTVMFHPSMRATWGRYTKEERLLRGLTCAYVLMEIVLWSAAAAQGVRSTVHVVVMVRVVMALAVTAGAVCVNRQLKKVKDFINMSHDIRLVGMLLLVMQCLHVGAHLAPMPPLAFKYYCIVLSWISHPPIIWITNIEPVRRVLRHIPRRRRSTIEQVMLVQPPRISSKKNSVAITLELVENPLDRQQPRREIACTDASRLSGIMDFLPLKEAFGEYCRRSLCSESFEFLLAVSEFKKDLALDAAAAREKAGKESTTKVFGGFGGYLAVVNDHIKDGSFYEINIDSRNKRDIMKHANFKDYAMLDLDGRMAIFSAAEGEIKKVLQDNLLNEFLNSPAYKAVVDFDGFSGGK
ncbi:unnamed protein product [Pylaiella littoralis]